MINIGIDSQTGLVYEGDITRGRGVWPTPVIAPAKFIFISQEDIKAESSTERFGWRFREDSYDPTSRIKRGRFYYADKSQPQHWQVMRHPGWAFDFITRDIHAFGKSLDTFLGNPIWHKVIDGHQEMPLVVLGVDQRFTVWSIIGIEATSTGEDLVTMKARSSFGILPQIKKDNVPDSFLPKLEETLATFTDEVHRASPVSVIDRARDAATYALLSHLNLPSPKAKDLADLIKKLDKALVIAINTATIINRLHARAKPSEQEKRNLRAVREHDAELATQCLGTLLCELSLAEWP